MDRTLDHLAEQIVIREKAIRRERMRKQMYAIGSMISVAFVLLIGYVTSMTHEMKYATDITQVYGTSLAASGIGGYVLTAVLAFFMGAFVTIFCLKMKKYMDEKQ